jgi:hypothetical protein
MIKLKAYIYLLYDMVNLFGRVYKKEDLFRHIGNVEQVGGLKLVELSETVERGVRAAIVRTGELSFLVAIDRAMDIVNADYKGIPLAFISPAGIAAPSFFEPEGLGWVRGFPGGLLTTCGLTYAGAPTVDQGEQLGLHGRISYRPAKLTYAGGYWNSNEYTVALEGEAKEARIFGANLTIKRRIEAKLGERRITIKDKVTNEGWDKQPLMIIYHMNFGFPILDSNSKLVSTSYLYFPRDAEAKAGAEKFNEFQNPTKGFNEKVYIHDLLADKDGYAYSAVINKKLLGGLGSYIKVRKKDLPRFIEWKMMGEGTYVLGMEPSNSFVMGRDRDRALGTLQYIDPQEEKEFFVETGVLEGEEIDKYEEKVDNITGKVKPKMAQDINEFLKMVKQ